MRAMKDSGIEWIGEIPREWDVVRIKYVLDKSEFGIKIGPFGSTLANRTLSSGEYSVYSQANLIANDFSETNHYIDKETFEDLRTYEVKPGDVCVSMMGTIGKCKEVPCGIREGIMDSHLIKIRLNGSRINPRFFEYVYDKDDSGVCYTQMQYEKKGTIMDGLNTTIVKNLFLTLPPLLVQEKIASCLDAKCTEIDALIASKEKTNALLKERRQSIIYEAVTKGLDPTATMKDSGVEWIGDIPETWEALRLKYCLEGIDSGTSVNSEDRPASAGEYGILKTSCVYSGSFDSDENKTVLGSEYGRVSCPVRANTLIVSRMNTADLIGACGYVENDYPNLFLPDRLWRLTFQDNCLPKYMWYFLSSKYAKNYYASLCTGTSGSMQNISQEQLSSIVFVRPPIKEQKAIVDELDSQLTTLDAIIGHNERTVEKLKEYRQSLIYEAVTGKVVI